MKYPWKPPHAQCLSESSVHPHVPEELAELFEAADGGSTEYEVLNWLHASVLLLKPQLVLETGAFNGIGTVALASACSANGFGMVHSLESDKESCDRVRSLLDSEGLAEWAQVHETDSLAWLRNTDLQFEIGFFDSDQAIRAVECEICLDRKMPMKLAVFHDTSPYRAISAPGFISEENQARCRNQIFALASRPECSGFYDSRLSRGFIALWLNCSAS